MATILASGAQLVEATSPQPTWQESLQRAFCSSRELLEYLGIHQANGGGLPQEAAEFSHFPVFVPREFAARMRPGDSQDPLLRQVLATNLEATQVVGFLDDAVGDKSAEILPGLLQKYAGRALLMVTGACAVHCRYCFRREFPYASIPKSPKGWQAAIDHIGSDTSLEEVILSGGDPLMTNDSNLGWLVEQLEALPHIQRLRIHSRMPVVIPQRVTDELLELLERTRLSTYFVCHINHRQEIDESVEQALRKIRRTGVVLLNQAVLLRGVNNSAELQKDLCSKLVNIGVIPYYLHQLDRVNGAAHFETSEEEGREIIAALRAQLPGYGVPKLVIEIAGDSSKRPL